MPEPDPEAIRSGAHADRLARQLYTWVKRYRPHTGGSTLHVFTACPVGFFFFLGRRARDWGEIQLYEHDRDRELDQPYLESLRVGGGREGP